MIYRSRLHLSRLVVSCAWFVFRSAARVEPIKRRITSFIVRVLPPSASTLPRVPIQSDPYQYSIKFAPQLAREKFNEPANRYLEVIPRPISTNLSCISGMMTAVTRRNYPAPGPISIMKIITSIYIPWIHSANTQRKYPITPLCLSPHCSIFWIPLKFKCPLVPGWAMG